MVTPLVLSHQNLVYLARPGREQPKQEPLSAGMWLAAVTSNFQHYLLEYSPILF